jgi:hypothetical protein
MQIEIVSGKKRLKELPTVVQDAVRGSFRYEIPKTVTVTSATKTRIGGSWHDYNVPGAVIIRDGKVVQAKLGCIYDVLINADAATRSFMDGEQVTLEENDIVVVTNTYPKNTATVYFHPSKLAIGVIEVDDDEYNALKVLDNIYSNCIGRMDRISRAMKAGMLSADSMAKLRKRKIINAKNCFTTFGRTVAKHI